MHNSVSFNGGLCAPTELTIPALSSAALFGKGIFTTLAVLDREPFLWEKHWQRLQESSRRLGLDLENFNEKKTRQAFEELVIANSVRNARARITFFEESASGVWPYNADHGTSLLIMTADLKPEPRNLSLTRSPYRLNSSSPLAGVKSCNYVEKILAKNEARQRGFDECLQLNERQGVTSAAMANVFWLKNGRLFTPSLDTGCLPGTTREFILENIECIELETGIEELRSSDQIFLTSAGLGVVQAAEFDGRELKHDAHPIMNLIPRRD